MTPITHAAVGTVIYEKLRKSPLGNWAWVAAFPLAFGSHYLLDAIPHFEGIYPVWHNRTSHSLVLLLGFCGSALALLLMRWYREKARIWFVLFLWVGIGSYSLSWLRIATALLAAAHLIWKSRTPYSVMYLLTGIVSVLPDLVSEHVHLLAVLHERAHFHADWLPRMHLPFAPFLMPPKLLTLLHDPRFALAYSFELLAETLIFFTAGLLFFQATVNERIVEEIASPEVAISAEPMFAEAEE